MERRIRDNRLISPGVTLLRAAAKNHKFVIVICDPGDYEDVMAEVTHSFP